MAHQKKKHRNSLYYVIRVSYTNSNIRNGVQVRFAACLRHSFASLICLFPCIFITFGLLVWMRVHTHSTRVYTAKKRMLSHLITDDFILFWTPLAWNILCTCFVRACISFLSTTPYSYCVPFADVSSVYHRMRYEASSFLLSIHPSLSSSLRPCRFSPHSIYIISTWYQYSNIWPRIRTHESYW